MRKLALAALILLMSSPQARAGYAGLDSFTVDESFKFQETPVWCWAATIQMALNYYGFNITQGEIVERTFGGFLESPANWLQMTNNLNFVGHSANGHSLMVSATVSRDFLSAESIINHLKNKRPVIVAFTNPSTFTGHAVLITGVNYQVVGNKAFINRIDIRDPFPYGPMHVANGGKVSLTSITANHIWLVEVTQEEH